MTSPAEQTKPAAGMDAFTEQGRCPACGKKSLFVVFEATRDHRHLLVDMECPDCLYAFQLRCIQVGIRELDTKEEEEGG